TGRVHSVLVSPVVIGGRDHEGCAMAALRAVPLKVWSAVLALVLLASLGTAVVLGAGLDVWRGSVGTLPHASRALAPLPGSGVIRVPVTATHRHHATSTGHPAPPVAPPAQVPTARVPTTPRSAPGNHPTHSPSGRPTRSGHPSTGPTHPRVPRPAVPALTARARALLRGLVQQRLSP